MASTNMTNLRNETNINTLLDMVVSLQQPNNFLIEAIKQDEKNASESIEKAQEKLTQTTKTVDKENADRNAQLDVLRPECEELYALNDSFIEFYKANTNAIENNSVPIDMANISKYIKNKTEGKETKISGLEEEIDKANEELAQLTEETEKVVAEAQEVIEDTPNLLYDEESRRKELNSVIDTAVNDGDLTKSRLRETLKKYGNVFSDQQIEKMLMPILFPDQGLRSAIERYEGKGRTTKEVLKEAMQQEATKEEKTTRGAKLDEAFKVIDTKKIEKKAEEKVVEEKSVSTEKKSETISNDDPKMEFLNSAFGATQLDVEFTPEVMEIGLVQLQEMHDQLVQEGYPEEWIKNISLKNLCNFNQYLENLRTMKAANLPVDGQTILKNPIIGVIPNDLVNNNIAIITYNGLTCVKPNGKIAVNALGRKKLDKAISLMGGIDLSYLKNDPENMAKIIGGIAARIYYCQQNGINYKDEFGNFESFIENEAEFTELYGVIDTSIIPSAKECNKVLLSTVENKEAIKELNDYHKTNSIETIDLNQDALNKFIEISEKVNALNEGQDSSEIIISGERFYTVDFQKNLCHLLSKNIQATDEELILTSLIFNAHKQPEAIKKIKLQLNPNTRNMGLATAA